MQIWRGLLLGTVGAALVALPAAVRAETARMLTWTWVWGSAALVLGPVIGAVRAIGPLPQGLRTLGSGLCLALPCLMLIGELLQRGTHHRPLGAVTFALIASGLVASCVALAGRLQQLRGASSRLIRLAAVGAVDVAVLIAAAWVATAVSHPALRWGLIDAVLAYGAVLTGVRLRLSSLPERWVRTGGPALWAIGVLAAVATPWANPAVRWASPVLTAGATWIIG
jgi:hypothetical protein